MTLGLRADWFSTLCLIADYGGRWDDEGHPLLRCHNGNPPAGEVTDDGFGIAAFVRFSTAEALARRELVMLDRENRTAELTVFGREMLDRERTSVARRSSTDAAERQARIEEVLA